MRRLLTSLARARAANAAANAARAQYHSLQSLQVSSLKEAAPCTNAASWATGSAAVVAALAGGTAAFLANENLEPEALADLAKDLTSGSSSDKERAVSMLSGLTMYIDHHDAILGTEVLDALMNAVTSSRLVPQARNIALTCTADLMKSPKAHDKALASTEFLNHLQAALQAKGTWAEGVDQGQAAQAQAARVVAELAGNPATHDALIKSGIAEQVVRQAADLVHEFGSVAGSYASVSEVPASMDAVAAMEEERFVAAAIFGLAGSKQGAALLSQHPETLQAIAHWAGSSKDVILQRWGVGALAKAIATDSGIRKRLEEVGALDALLSALSSSDPQAQCYATAAIGTTATSGDGVVTKLVEKGVGQALTRLLQESDKGRSAGVAQGVLRCVLRCINTCADNPQLAAALRQAGAAEVLQGLLQGGKLGSEELQRLAAAAAQKLAA